MTKTNIAMVVLFILLVFSIIFASVSFSNLKDTQKKLVQAKEEITKLESVDELNQASEEFVEAFIQGNYKRFITGAELEKYESSTEGDYKNDETFAKTAGVKIKQFYTKLKKDTEDLAESFVTVEVRYKTDESETYSNDYFQIITLNTDWIKINGDWKVERIDVALVSDSEFDEARKEAEEALREAEESNENE